MPSNDFAAIAPASHAAQHHLALAAQMLPAAKPDSTRVALTGYGLTLGEVVAGARHGTPVAIDETPEIVGRIDESVAFLKSKLHTSIYGVSSGYGMSTSRSCCATR